MRPMRSPSPAARAMREAASAVASPLRTVRRSIVMETSTLGAADRGPLRRLVRAHALAVTQRGFEAAQARFGGARRRRLDGAIVAHQSDAEFGQRRAAALRAARFGPHHGVAK